MFKDTIFALSSAKGKAAISVYRLSGTMALDVIKSLTGIKSEIEPRKSYRAKLFNPFTREEIDDAIFVYFKAPNSFTGEDIIEIYAHGSIAISNSLSEAVLAHSGVRFAEKGEFTRRAVMNSKMDLLSAEGLIDLINSETAMQKKQALNQYKGILYNLSEKWREEIVKIMSLVEAYIDFPDEDIPNSVILDAENKINSIKNSLSSFLNDNNKGERLKSGIKLAIFGKPNVGKSSLINYLTKRDISIVSSISGTTRDIIESHIDISGYPFTLVDTAGIHNNTEDEIELEGIKRAKEAVENADLKIYIQSAEDEEKIYLDEENTIHVINKIDIENYSDNRFIKISVKNNIGMDILLSEIESRAKNLVSSGEDAVITSQRQRDAIKKAKAALDKVNLTGDLILAAEDLRITSRELQFLIGRVDVEDILDQVFSSFCIGK